jgi:hypothetical protein
MEQASIAFDNTHDLSIRQSAVDRAIRMLASAGARYAVIFNGGPKVGDLDVVIEAERAERPKEKRVKLKEHYEGILATVEPGDHAFIRMPRVERDSGELVTVKTFQAAIGSWCARYWGQGMYVTECRPDGVSVLRLVP